MKKVSNWLWGGVLVALGVILGLNALEITDVNLFFPGWWTLFIIVPCAIGLITDRDKGGNIIGLMIGVGLLLGCLNVVSFSMMWKLVLPLILVGIGLSLIVKNASNASVSKKIRQAEQANSKKRQQVAEGEVVEEATAQDREEYWSTFSEQKIDYEDKTFTRCKVDAIFGGAELDLRRAKIRNEAVIRSSSVFGGVVIYLPEDVKVEIAANSIFGGVTDKRMKKSEGKADKTVYIDASCVFGGLELR